MATTTTQSCAAADRLVSDVLEILPSGAAVVVTADHGQVHVGANIIDLPADVEAHVSYQSGEGRFRWLHARPGRATMLLEAAQHHFSDDAWVRTVDETIAEGWWGPTLTDDARNRLGDVALVAHADVSFNDAADSGPFKLIGRHGSADRSRDACPPAGRNLPRSLNMSSVNDPSGSPVARVSS